MKWTKYKIIPKRTDLNVKSITVRRWLYILKKDGRIVLSHTEVPKAMEGQGVGSKLAKAAFAYAKENELKVMPLCPFMASYLRRHRDEYAGMLASGFNV